MHTPNKNHLFSLIFHLSYNITIESVLDLVLITIQVHKKLHKIDIISKQSRFLCCPGGHIEDPNQLLANS